MGVVGLLVCNFTHYYLICYFFFLVNHGAFTRFSLVLFLLHVLYFSTWRTWGSASLCRLGFYLPTAVAEGGFRGEIQR